jgi:glycosyltransferase involved in cell wall biosynthesis
MSISISVIVTTYNRPLALDCVLASLENQSILPSEIIIADDGSRAETKSLIESWQSRMPCTLKHAWQADDGFRAAGVRNLAVANSTGNYLIFLDGDCLVFSDFIKNHIALSEPDWMVIGSRILCNVALTKEIESKKKNPLNWGFLEWVYSSAIKEVNRIFPLIRLPNIPLRKLRSLRWEGVRTFNLGVWRKDFIAVNGFDESFQGWGHEDADLAVRLLKIGVKRKDGQFSLPVLHLWHQESSRTNEAENLRRLMARIDDKQTKASIGLNQYI